MSFLLLLKMDLEISEDSEMKFSLNDFATFSFTESID